MASAMAQILTEPQIQALLSEKKLITAAQMARLMYPRKTKTGRGGLSGRVKVTGKNGTRFILRARRSAKRPMEFSVILALAKGGRKQLNLIRCNGHHGPHPNWLERITIPRDTCHVHRITERYQLKPMYDPEQFATETLAYNSFEHAVEFFCNNFGIFVKGAPPNLLRDHE